MTTLELKAGYDFGRDAIKTYIENKEPIPSWVVERTLALADQLIDKLEDEEVED